MRKKSIYFSIIIILLALSIKNVYAYSYRTEDIPNNSYVIGTHLFTRKDLNENYDGTLRTKHIMLAARSIIGTDLDDMIIYSKDPRGNWYDELADQLVKMGEEIEIEYINTIPYLLKPIAVANIITEGEYYTAGYVNYEIQLANLEEYCEATELDKYRLEVFEVEDDKYNKIGETVLGGIGTPIIVRVEFGETKKIVTRVYKVLSEETNSYSPYSDELTVSYLRNGWNLVKSENGEKYDFAYYENGIEMMRKSNMIYAHRGWQTVPENSLESFKLVKENGYYGFETDVRFTKDGVAVLSHDQTINRIARNHDDLSEIEEELKVKDLTLEELYNYDFVVTTGGKVLSEYKGNKITKFEEAVAYASNNKLTITIDLYVETEDQIRSLVEMIRNYDMDNRVQWIASNVNLLKYVKKYDNDGYEFMRLRDVDTTDLEKIKEKYDTLKEDSNNLIFISPSVSEGAFNDVGFEKQTLNLPGKQASNPANMYDISSKKYTITFDSDGGSEVDSQVVNYDQKIELPTNPIKSGYIFREWQLDGKTFDLNTRISKNITLKATWDEAPIYDVILFWGESNMLGYAGEYKGENGEDQIDQRLVNMGVDEFSNNSGIDLDIINGYTAINHVNVDVPRNVAFDFTYDYDNTKSIFTPITKDTLTLGKKLGFAVNDTEISFYNYVSGKNSNGMSRGTNLIPNFAKTYYEETGHGVVAILAAHTSLPIKKYLSNEQAIANNVNQNTWYYMYESMTRLYEHTIEYMNQNGLQVGNKFYVAFEGESDAKGSITQNDYENVYKIIHNDLKNDLGLSFGVIIETSQVIGSSTLEGVEKIHAAQENLINNNEDIILGSTYSYDKYIPNKEASIYKDDTEEVYNQAVNNALLSMCVSEKSVDTDGNQKNLLNFNSAALSQIGKETALSIANYLNQ